MSAASTNTATTTNAAHDEKSAKDESHTKATESGYLQNQVNEASAAMSAAMAAIKKDLLGAANPGTLTKQYPWAAVGAAAVAGFVAASAVVPSKEEQALKKLERIERALRPTGEHPVPPHQPGQHGKGNQSMGSRIFSEIFSAIKPALSSALAAYAAAPGANENQNGNGHASAGAAAGNAAYYADEPSPSTDPDQA